MNRKWHDGAKLFLQLMDHATFHVAQNHSVRDSPVNVAEVILWLDMYHTHTHTHNRIVLFDMHLAVKQTKISRIC